MIQQVIQNDVSSTKIRLFLRREMSVRYLIPRPVINYIEENGLYLEEGKQREKVAEKAAETPRDKERERAQGQEEANIKVSGP